MKTNHPMESIDDGVTVLRVLQAGWSGGGGVMMHRVWCVNPHRPYTHSPSFDLTEASGASTPHQRRSGRLLFKFTLSPQPPFFSAGWLFFPPADFWAARQGEWGVSARSKPAQSASRKWRNPSFTPTPPFAVCATIICVCSFKKSSLEVPGTSYTTCHNIYNHARYLKCTII